MAGRQDPAAVVLGRAIDEVPLGADDVDTRAHEVLSPAVGVEPDDVVGKQSVVKRNANRFRQHAPVVGLGPRDVNEMGERSLGHARPDKTRGEVQVVVVKENGCIGLSL
jgi:hypothetical protein